MRLSEAIALGRTAVIPRKGVILDPDGGGCALGMTGVACGTLTIGESAEGRFLRLERAFPWAMNTECAKAPCECMHLEFYKVTGIVGHLFDKHVMSLKDWTLDQVIDWVRSVEPQETPTEAPALLESAPLVRAKVL